VNIKLFVWGPEANRPTLDLHADRRIIIKWIPKKYGVRVWNGFISLRLGTSVGLL
jgi:hypothetical protein